MPARRIIPCLDVKDGRVVKGVQFRGYEIVGDVLECALLYAREGADELVLYDIAASTEGRSLDPSTIREIARRIDVPFAVAGGLRTVEQAISCLENGADKISINSPALERPEFIDELARIAGAQCVVVGVDSFEEEGEYYVYQYTGDETKSRCSGRATFEWLREIEDRGAGEVVLNCMNRDGMRAGYDLRQLAKARSILNVPLIASGGAGEMEHFFDVFSEADVSGALAASVFHKGLFSIPDLKKYLRQTGLEIR
ncbi:MAG: imidazole glycerol phosphate synthase subunit HisF [Parvularculaceae bacterium]